jgi:hypothetical protein
VYLGESLIKLTKANGQGVGGPPRDGSVSTSALQRFFNDASWHGKEKQERERGEENEDR